MAWLGHATVLINFFGVKILTDPWFVDGEYYGSWAHYPPYAFDPAAFADLDFIYISHIHPDHLSRKTMALLPRHVPVLIHAYATNFLRASVEALGFRAIELPRSVAFQFRDDTSAATALFTPTVGELTEELRDAVHASDVVMFDGTFWSDDELAAVRPGARSAREMNHLPISDGSLDFLRQSRALRKIYTHINNTNPILVSGTREREQVEQAGIEIARDGLEIVL